MFEITNHSYFPTVISVLIGLIYLFEPKIILYEVFMGVPSMSSIKGNI
jgi:hypothetical protein